MKIEKDENRCDDALMMRVYASNLPRYFIHSKNPWWTLRYKAGKYNKFKFDIALFRGVNESKRSYFGIDDIKVHKQHKTMYDIYTLIEMAPFVNKSKELLKANITK